jgi:hypothetical protein
MTMTRAMAQFLPCPVRAGGIVPEARQRGLRSDLARVMLTVGQAGRLPEPGFRPAMAWLAPKVLFMIVSSRRRLPRHQSQLRRGFLRDPWQDGDVLVNPAGPGPKAR